MTSGEELNLYRKQLEFKAFQVEERKEGLQDVEFTAQQQHEIKFQYLLFKIETNKKK